MPPAPMRSAASLPTNAVMIADAFLESAIAYFQQRGVRIKRVMTDNCPGYVSHAFRTLAASTR